MRKAFYSRVTIRINHPFLCPQIQAKRVLNVFDTSNLSENKQPILGGSSPVRRRGNGSPPEIVIPAFSNIFNSCLRRQNTSSNWPRKKHMKRLALPYCLPVHVWKPYENTLVEQPWESLTFIPLPVTCGWRVDHISKHHRNLWALYTSTSAASKGGNWCHYFSSASIKNLMSWLVLILVVFVFIKSSLNNLLNNFLVSWRWPTGYENKLSTPLRSSFSNSRCIVVHRSQFSHTDCQTVGGDNSSFRLWRKESPKSWRVSSLSPLFRRNG